MIYITFLVLFFSPLGELVYSITSGDPGSLFNIDSSTGVITLAKALDFETDTSHTLEVTVTVSKHGRN